MCIIAAAHLEVTVSLHALTAGNWRAFKVVWHRPHLP
jgi:hypothetical protein